MGGFLDDFDGGALEPDVWIAHYLPQHAAAAPDPGHVPALVVDRIRGG